LGIARDGETASTSDAGRRARLAEIDEREKVVRQALEMLDSDLGAAKRAAASKALPQVREAVRPLVAAAVRKLLDAVVAVRVLNNVSEHLRQMELPAADATMPGFPPAPFAGNFIGPGQTGLNDFGRHVRRAEAAGFITREEGDAYRRAVPGCG
jgi:hypothetical protein